ncbi:MAG: phage baseplate assembly protein V [Desulfovibrio sp.]|nr:phage baseplate assembly protein V [Desulfovibrio sp.]
MTPEMILDKMSQMIRVGFVNARQPEKMRLKVTLRDTTGAQLVTDWLPVLCPRASGDMQYDLPDVGDQVLCLFLPYGLEQGFVVGAMYGKQTPPVQSGDKWHRKFADGTTLEYDRASHKLTANVQGDVDGTATGSVTMKAQGPMTLEAPIVYVRGTLVNTAKDGSPGKAVISGGVEVSNGGINVLSGDVVAAGVSLVSHTTEGVQAGSGTSGTPTGGSAKSPGTGPVSPEMLPEEKQMLMEGQSLSALAMDLAERGDATERLLLCLPKIAEAMAAKVSGEENKRGWSYLATFFRRWLAGGPNKDALKGGPPSHVAWAWLMGFERVQKGVAEIKDTLFTKNAEALLLERLQRDEKLKDARCDFNYIHPHAQSHRKDVPEWQQWRDSYYQSVPIERQKIPSLEAYGSTVDGLMAAMGSFMIYALAKGYTMPSRNGGHDIFIEEVALVAWDTFNFDGDEDDYHYWRCEPPDFCVDQLPGYTHLTNEPFRKLQTKFGHGSNFVVISGPETVELERGHEYHVSC